MNLSLSIKFQIYLSIFFRSFIIGRDCAIRVCDRYFLNNDNNNGGDNEEKIETMTLGKGKNTYDYFSFIAQKCLLTVIFFYFCGFLFNDGV